MLQNSPAKRKKITNDPNDKISLLPSILVDSTGIGLIESLFVVLSFGIDVQQDKRENEHTIIK